MDSSNEGHDVFVSTRLISGKLRHKTGSPAPLLMLFYI